MKKIYLVFLLIVFNNYAQTKIIGCVKNAITTKPISFVSISNNEDIFFTDSNGNFTVNVNPNSTEIIFSRFGYKTKTIEWSINKKYYTIYLFPDNKITKLKLLENKQKALSITTIVQQNKTLNNPLERNQNFNFKSYNKLVVNAYADSLSGKIDTIFYGKIKGFKIKKIDSANYKLKRIVEKQNLFETEKVSVYQFDKNNLKETILGTKMSGFKEPVYQILGFKLQSFSIYDNQYELFETLYQNPISKSGIKEYDFVLLDTIFIQNRSSYLVYFKNKKKIKAKGLEGVLYIDTENYAIAKAEIQIKSVLNITSLHEFDYLKNEKIWFPSTTNFKIIKGKNSEDIKILGGTIQFEGDAQDGLINRKKTASDFVYLESNTKNFELQYGIAIQIRRPKISIAINDNASKQKNDFWYKYRQDSLDIRSERTYSFVDSIAIKNRVERRLFFGKKIIDGFVSLPYFDFDVRKLLNFNNYEGFRLSTSLVTNDRFSKIFRVNGYAAYGTKDGNFKFGLGSAVRIGRTTNSWIGAAFANDINDIAQTEFLVEEKQYTLLDTKFFNLSYFYNYIQYKTYLETRLIPKTETIWELASTEVVPKFNYLYQVENKFFSEYRMTTAQVSLLWSPFSDFMQTPFGLIETQKRYPKYSFQILQSLPNILKNDFRFTKFDFKTEYLKKFLNGQTSKISLVLGYAVGNIPLTHLYNSSPNSLNKDKLLQRLTGDGSSDFETMYFNEFFSNQFASLEVRHDFKRFMISKKIKPGIALITRIAIGTMDKPEQHLNLQYKTLEDGFVESGVQINKIFKGFGIASYYRYGPNHLPTFDENLAIRFTFKLDLGM